MSLVAWKGGNETNTVATIQGVRGYTDAEGTAHLNIEDVARGLGFTETKDGVEYVKWRRVNRYLQELGFSTQVAKDDFVPENIFYRLAMKAKNAVAEAFQAKVADETLPAIRKNGYYSIATVTNQNLPLYSMVTDIGETSAVMEKYFGVKRCCKR